MKSLSPFPRREQLALRPKAKQQRQSKAQHPTHISAKKPLPPAVPSLLGEGVKEALRDYTSKPPEEPQNQISNGISLLASRPPPRRFTLLPPILTETQKFGPATRQPPLLTEGERPSRLNSGDFLVLGGLFDSSLLTDDLLQPLQPHILRGLVSHTRLAPVQ